MKRFMSGAAAGRAGLVCAMLLVTTLTGCGGGGDSSSPPPPVGGNPPTPPAPPPPPPPPPPATVSLTLEGTVTDEPIANAIVTATVAGEEFTATADAEGNYSLDIEIEEADAADAFITLNARGTGDQAFVEFTSIVGSFETLSTAAGEDGTLTSSENFATQITNVSTAAAVLMVEANGGNAVTSDTTLSTLSAQLNAQDVLDVATAIKLAVDEPETHPLPDGTDSLLALVASAESREQFVDTAYQQDPAAFAATQGAIAADPSLAQNIDEAALIAREAMTTAMLSTDAGFTFNYTGRIVHFDFEADHTGWLTTDTHNVPMTWSVVGKELRISYPEPIVTVSFDTEDCVNDGGVRQVEAHYSSSGDVVTFLSANQVAITSTSDIAYVDCASLEPRTVTTTSARTVLSESNAQPLVAADIAGTVQTLYVWGPQQQKPIADIADLGDGVGHTRLTNLDFTWTMDGNLVHAEFSNGSVAEFAVLQRIDDVVTDIYWEVRAPNDGPVFAGAGAQVEGEPAGSLTLTDEAVIGRYYQFGIGDETIPDERLKGFRLRFDADHFGAQETDYIDENDTLVTTNEDTNPVNAFRWSIESDSIFVRRTWDTVAEVDGCLYTEANCELWDQRRIIPLAQEGSRVYVLELRRTNYDGGITQQTPASFLVRYYDFEAPAVGVAKMRPVKANGFKSRALVTGAGMR